jgi:hypothetical protein
MNWKKSGAYKTRGPLALFRLRDAGLLLAALLTGACARSAPPIPPPVPAPANVEIETSVFFIGDAGEPAEDGEPSLIGLATELTDHPEETLVVFLGDNVYPRGLPDSSHQNRAQYERYLAEQIDVVVETEALGIFIPGNHDWAMGGRDGLNSILRQARFIESRGGDRVRMLPTDGCPGPSVIDIGDGLRLIFVDTQWWLQGNDRPFGSDSGCPAGNEPAFLESLTTALATAGDRTILVAGHHPMRTSSKHGGFWPWTAHIFPLQDVVSWLWLPLPGIGSLYPLSRMSGITNQDVSGPKYKKLIAAFDSVFAAHPPLVYASGHEHILEVLEWDSAQFLLVSGGGIYGHGDPVTARDQTRFVAQASGFMRVDLMTDGRVRLGVIVVDETGETTEEYSRYLK